MEKHYTEMLRFQLMEEIERINAQVTALGMPRSTVERSLIARYGKLLFVSQQLLEAVPRLQALAKSSPSAAFPGGEQMVVPSLAKRYFSRRFGLS